MPDVTFTEFRNRAKYYFDAVEAGKSVRVSRNGKPIAEIVPILRRGAIVEKNRDAAIGQGTFFEP